MDLALTTRWLLLGAGTLVGAAVAVKRALDRAARANLPPDATELRALDGVADGAVVALHGRLRDRASEEGVPLAATAHDTDGRVHRARADALVVALDDGAEVALQGMVTVQRGAVTAPLAGEAGERVRAWVAVLSGRARAEVDAHTREVSAVCAGERVVAVGRARVEVSAGEHGGAYREARVERRVVLEPLVDGHVHLYGDAPPVLGPVARAGLRGGAWGVVGAGVVLWALGALMMALAAPSTRHRFEGTRMYATFTGRAWAASAARVSPFAERHADAALARATWQVPRLDEATYRAALALALRAGDCALAHELPSRRGRWDEARDAVARCPIPIAHREGLAAFAAGDFSTASSLLPGRSADVVSWAGVDVLLTAARAHLLAGDLPRATRVVRAMAVMRALPGLDPNLRSPNRLDGDNFRRVLTCVGDHLGALSGEPGAFTNLRAAARADASGWCAALAYDVRAQHPGPLPIETPDERDALRFVDPTVVPHGVRGTVDAPCGEDWSALLFAPTSAMTRRSPGSDHAHARASFHEADGARRLDALCSAIAFDALAGDAAGTTARLEEGWHALESIAAADRAPWYVYGARDFATLGAAVNVMVGRDDGARTWLARAGGATPATVRLRALLDLRGATTGAEALVVAEAAMPRDSATGWRAVAAGDADALLRQLYTHDWNGLGPWILWGSPRVPVARHDEVARWLLWTAPAPCVTCSLRRRVEQLAARDRAVRLYGGESPDARTLEALRGGMRRRNTAASLAALDALDGALLR